MISLNFFVNSDEVSVNDFANIVSSSELEPIYNKRTYAIGIN